jgi:hypothetical protein
MTTHKQMCLISVGKDSYMFASVNNDYFGFIRWRMIGYETNILSLNHKAENINFVIKEANGGRFK